MPQPYFVPVRPAFLRGTPNSGGFGSTSMLCDCPLMVSATMFSLSRSPIGESFSASARGGLFRRNFCKRALAESLAVSTHVRHRNSVNGIRCHRCDGDCGLV